MNRVEEAYAAIRAHNHEHPYLKDPSRVYGDIGDLTSLLGSLVQLMDGMARAAEKSTGTDDGEPHGTSATINFADASGAIARAKRSVEFAHINVGHLIFGGGDDDV